MKKLTGECFFWLFLMAGLGHVVWHLADSKYEEARSDAIECYTDTECMNLYGGDGYDGE